MDDPKGLNRDGGVEILASKTVSEATNEETKSLGLVSFILIKIFTYGRRLVGVCL